VAFQGRKTAAARGRPGERLPSCAHPRGLPGHGKPSTASRSAAHSPAVKDQLTYTPLAAWQGFGGASPQREGLTTPALPGASVPVLHAQYLRPTSTDGQDRTPSRDGGAATAQRATRMLASPCVGASSAGGSVRGASATCELQPRLVPRRQSEAGASKRMGANRHGGRRCRPRWSWKSPFEIERIQGRLGVAALQMFTRMGGGTNNEAFRDMSEGAPSGFVAHETCGLTGLDGVSDMKDVALKPSVCTNNSVPCQQLGSSMKAIVALLGNIPLTA
jgi:hypothetical protein